MEAIKNLDKYKVKDHFIFKPTDNLAQVCNAPKGCSGIYLIYALSGDKKELIYVGISGRMDENGQIKHRRDGLRGRFITGKTNGILRKKYWPMKMIEENIDALHIDWYVTYGECDEVFPRELEIELLKNYQKTNNGKLPAWNSKI